MFRRTLFHFEAPEAGGGGEPTAVSEPVAPEAATPEPAAEPSWAFTRDDYETLQQQQEQLSQGLAYIASSLQNGQQRTPEPQAGPELPQLDPFAEDFAEQLAYRDQAIMQQVVSALRQEIAPLTQFQQQQQLAEGEELAYDILADNVSQFGEFVEQDTAFEQARALANVFLEEEAERYGMGPRAGEAALVRAANAIRERDNALSQAAVEKYKNELAGLSGAPAEPAAAGAGAQMTRTDHGDLRDVVRKYYGG